MSDEWKDFLDTVKPIKNRKRSEVNSDKHENDEQGNRSSFKSNITMSPKLDKSSEYSKNIEVSDFSRVDGSHSKKLKKGSFAPEATIDLHGFRLHEAEEKFFEFILQCYALNKRYILVITGKGVRDKGKVSVIKQSVPKWINSSDLSGKILAVTHAHKKHGGEGAYYILLKK